MNRPQLGTWHEVRRIAVKRRYGIRTAWESYDAPQPDKAMYIGYRTVFDGQMETQYEQDGWENPRYEVGRFFVQSKPLEVWLFVWNGRMNPIRVFPQDTDFSQESEKES